MKPHSNDINPSGERNGINLSGDMSIGKDDLLHYLLDMVPDHIYIKDAESRFILANRKCAAVHGLSSGKMMVGKTDHDFYPAELADKYFLDEQKLINEGQSLIGIEEQGIDEIGNKIFLSTTKIPMKDNSGKIVGIIGIGRDISKRKEAEQKLRDSTEQLRALNSLLKERQEIVKQQAMELAVQAENLDRTNLELQKLSEAINETDNVVVIVGSDGNFEWANKSLEKTYGCNLSQYIDKFGKNILDGSMNSDIRNIMAECRATKETIRYQTKIEDKNGIRRWIQSTLSPVLDDNQKIIRFITIDTDITALKNAEELIKQQKNELEKHGIELEKANITKDKFFSIIAHDLKNPFHAILGFSELISKEYDEIPDDKKREYLGLIHESSQYAHNLLENLLNWSRTQMDRIKYSPSPVSLFDAISEILYMVNSSLEKKNILFNNQVPRDTTIWADANMIQTVLRNLVSNAIKFTPEKGSISITSVKGNGKTIISVQDNGVGMTSEQQKKLFEMGEFHTSPGTEGEQGTGLGLIICQEFVRKHNGSLRIESSPGKGTTISFDLPSDKPAGTEG